MFVRTRCLTMVKIQSLFEQGPVLKKLWLMGMMLKGLCGSYRKMTFSESDGRLQKCDAPKGTGTHESLDRHFPLKWQYHEFCNPCFFPGSNPSGLFIHAWKYFRICPRCYWDRAESNISKFSNAFWSNLKRQVHQVFTFLCWGSRFWKYFSSDFDFF